MHRWLALLAALYGMLGLWAMLHPRARMDALAGAPPPQMDPRGPQGQGGGPPEGDFGPGGPQDMQSPDGRGPEGRGPDDRGQGGRGQDGRGQDGRGPEGRGQAWDGDFGPGYDENFLPPEGEPGGGEGPDDRRPGRGGGQYRGDRDPAGQGGAGRGREDAPRWDNPDALTQQLDFEGGLPEYHGRPDPQLSIEAGGAGHYLHWLLAAGERLQMLMLPLGPPPPESGKLSLRLRGSGARRIGIVLRSRDGRSFVHPVELSSDWQTLELPLGEFHERGRGGQRQGGQPGEPDQRGGGPGRGAGPGGRGGSDGPPQGGSGGPDAGPPQGPGGGPQDGPRAGPQDQQRGGPPDEGGAALRPEDIVGLELRLLEFDGADAAFVDVDEIHYIH